MSMKQQGTRNTRTYEYKSAGQDKIGSKVEFTMVGHGAAHHKEHNEGDEEGDGADKSRRK